MNDGCLLAWQWEPLHEDVSVGGVITERKIKTDHHSNPRVVMEILQGFNFRSWITFFFPLVFSTVHIEEVLFDNVKIYNDQTRTVSLPAPYLAISPLCRAASNSSSS